MENVEIREYTDVDMDVILALYSSVGWTNYTNNPSMLESSYHNSLKTLAAWSGDKLLGIIRAVGDGFSIVYIQDIIVFPEYQRQGIGRKLIMSLDELYSKVYQKVLMTDNTEKTIKFYESCGFVNGNEYEGVAFVKYLA